MPSDRERVVADPDLLRDASARYAGVEPLLDVLWWAEHPGEPTPDGHADPARAVAEARLDLYRPGAAGDAEAVRRAADAVTADRASAVEAVAGAVAARASHRGDARARPGLRRRTLAGAVVAAAFVAGAAGFVAGRAQPAAPPPAFAVFDRAQAPGDRPPRTAPLPSQVRAGTLRAIGAANSSGTVLYAARSSGDRVCLVAVVLATDYVASCTPTAAFRVGGLTVAFQAATDPQDGFGSFTLHRITATWTPAGSVAFS